jgi:hypothetical protein
MSDSDLRQVAWKIADPGALEGVVEIIPTNVGTFYVEAEYDLPRSMGALRCAHCPQHQRHRKGVVVRTPVGRHLVGSTCGPKAFSADYGLASKARETAQRRYDALVRQDRLRDQGTAAVDIFEMLAASDDVKAFDSSKAMMQRFDRQLLADLAKIASTPGGAILTEWAQERDFAAEEERKEAWAEAQASRPQRDIVNMTTTQRKRELAARRQLPTLNQEPLYHKVNRVVGQLGGAAWLALSERMSARLAGDIDAIRRRLAECREVTDGWPLGAMESSSRALEAALRHGYATIALFDRYASFFSPENLSRVQRWAQHRYASVRLTGDRAGFRSANVGFRERMFFQDSATASHVVQLGQYFFSSPLPPAVVAAIAAYLVGRSGRKVRLKWGDKEAEVGSIKEVEELFKLANALEDSASQQSCDGQKSTPAPPK